MFIYITYTDCHGVERVRSLGSKRRVERVLRLQELATVDWRTRRVLRWA